jgi:hypothetical protein
MVVPRRAAAYDVFDTVAEDAPPLPRGPGGGSTKAGKPPRGGADAAEVAARLGIVLPRRSRVKDDVAAEVVKGREEVEQLAEGSFVRDVILPIPIMLAGLALSFVQVQNWAEKPVASAGEAVGVVLAGAIGSVALMMFGMFVLTSAFDVTFVGRFARSALRLAAIAIGPAAIQSSVAVADGGEIAGTLMGIGASLVAYALLFWGLMRLDLRDTTVCVVVTWILCTFAAYAAWRAEGMIKGTEI